MPYRIGDGCDLRPTEIVARWWIPSVLLSTHRERSALPAWASGLDAIRAEFAPADGTVLDMSSGGRTRSVRRLLVCLGVGALAPLGSISVGSFPAAVVVGLVLALIAWIVWGMLDAAEDERS